MTSSRLIFDTRGVLPPGAGLIRMRSGHKARICKGFNGGSPHAWIWRCGEDRHLQKGGTGFGFTPTWPRALEALLEHCAAEHGDEHGVTES